MNLSGSPLEKDEQQAVRGILKAVGFTVHNTSQARASKVALGLPDLVILHPGIGKGGWWEVKRYKDRGYLDHDQSTWVPMPLRAEQAEFRTLALASGQLHGWGGRKEVLAFLMGLGLAIDVRGEIRLRPWRAAA